MVRRLCKCCDGWINLLVGGIIMAVVSDFVDFRNVGVRIFRDDANPDEANHIYVHIPDQLKPLVKLFNDVYPSQVKS